MAPTYSLMPDSWRELARALVAEMVGTMFLVIIGCGAAVNWKTSFDVTQVSNILLRHQLLVWATLVRHTKELLKRFQSFLTPIII